MAKQVVKVIVRILTISLIGYILLDLLLSAFGPAFLPYLEEEFFNRERESDKVIRAIKESRVLEKWQPLLVHKSKKYLEPVAK